MPNSRHAPNAPCGVHLPKITAASAMKPWPATAVCVNWEMIASVMDAPPNPAMTPESTTQMKRVRLTLMPRVSAAAGCSPTARTRRPHLVL
ncbi:Uncharacterised protein [Collinsella intestinalis]|nr:Uncharacterised protein [Collinsella intestinalis]